MTKKTITIHNALYGNKEYTANTFTYEVKGFTVDLLTVNRGRRNWEVLLDVPGQNPYVAQGRTKAEAVLAATTRLDANGRTKMERAVKEWKTKA